MGQMFGRTAPAVPRNVRKKELVRGGKGGGGKVADTTVNKAVGQNRIQLLPRCRAKHSECCLFPGLPVETRSLLYSG